jgi:acetyl-CoA acetyltransferase family protein
MLSDAYIVDAIRTPIGRYGVVLSPVRADDLGAVPIKALMERQPSLDWSKIDDVYYGCANQAGEDNRDVARMSSLLAGLPIDVPGSTINRLCGSGMDAVGTAARAIRSGDTQLMLAGGVESMSRAPFVMGKAEQPFSRQAEIFDTTIGWRFVNPLLKKQYGVDSMPETAENVAADFNISREDQDAYALRSQQRVAAAQKSGRMAREITPVWVPRRKQEPLVVDIDEHPRETSLEKLAKLPTPFRENGTVTPGNASGVNDAACALLLASGDALRQYDLNRSIRAGGGHAGDKVHVAYGYGLFTGGLGAHYGAERLGCTVIPMSGGQTEKQVQLIHDFEPDTILHAQYCRRDGPPGPGSPQAASAAGHLRGRTLDQQHAHGTGRAAGH